MHHQYFTYMKRILFVGTGEQFPKGAFAFLQSLQDRQDLCVTGLFFCPLDYAAVAAASHVPIATPYLKVREREKAIVDRQKALFHQECNLRHIKNHLHENDDRWDKTLFARESRFSDLVVLSGELFCDDSNESQPNFYLQEALHSAECPVMIVPEDYTPPAHLVIGYDGSKDSVYAIKQFCYLFPQYTDLPTELVYVRDEPSEEIPEMDKLRHFAQLHFSSLGLSKLHFKAAKYFSEWLNEKSPVMLITGSYGRSAFSYVTKKSFAEQAIHHHGMPLFIAHM